MRVSSSLTPDDERHEVRLAADCIPLRVQDRHSAQVTVIACRHGCGFPVVRSHRKNMTNPINASDPNTKSRTSLTLSEKGREAMGEA